jgi:D-amino-acid dehydrogenase
LIFVAVEKFGPSRAVTSCVRAQRRNDGWLRRRRPAQMADEADAFIDVRRGNLTLEQIDDLKGRRPFQGSRDAIVVGAGVVGVTTAYFLQKNGWKVTLVDALGSPASSTSYANAGFITPSQTAPRTTYADLWRFLFRRPATTGEPPPPPTRLKWSWELMRWAYSFSDSIGWVKNEQAADVLSKLAVRSRDLTLRVIEENKLQVPLRAGTFALLEAGQQVEPPLPLVENRAPSQRWDVDRLIAEEPALSSLRGQLQGARFVPGDLTGDARWFTAQLAQVVERNGGKMLWNTPVKRLVLRQNGLEVGGVETMDGRVLRAEYYVLCTGPETADLLRASDIRHVYIPIAPLKGHSITVKLKRPVLNHGIYFPSSHAYVTPLGNELRATVGADFVGNDRSLDPAKVDYLKAIVQRIVPADALADDHPISAWTGLRPYTPDGLPLVGPLPFFRNCLVNSGHGTLGWTLACATAELLVGFLYTHLKDQSLEQKLLMRAVVPMRFNEGLLQGFRATRFRRLQLIREGPDVFVAPGLGSFLSRMN